MDSVKSRVELAVMVSEVAVDSFVGVDAEEFSDDL